MRRIMLACLIAACALGLAAQEALAFGFSLEPSRVELSVPQGKRRGQTITVNNTGNPNPVHLQVYVRDVIYLPDGTNDFPEAGSTEWTCAEWLKVSPQEVDIPAGKTAEVRISASAPADAAGGHYAVLFFETGPSYDERGIGINFRLGALVEVLIPGTAEYQAELANLDFVAPNRIEIGIFNQGNALFRPKGKLKILNAEGKRVGQIDFNSNGLGVLPKTLRQFAEELTEPLEPGTYRLRAEIDYGTKYLLVGELPMSVP